MKKILISSVLLVGLALSANAQEKVLSLQQCIDIALRQNYSIEVASKQVERAKVLQGTAWDVGKTDVSLSQDPTSGGSPDNAISVSQQIEFPTVYIARHKQLKAETQAERSKLDMQKATLAAEVASVYYQLVYQKQRILLLSQQDSVLSQYQQLAEKRFRAGETRRLEVISAERMLRENLLAKQMAQSEAETVRMQLAKLLNVDMNYTGAASQYVSIEPAESELHPMDFTQSTFNYQQTPEGVYANDRLTVADRALAVARNGYAPSLSLSLRNQLVITSWDPYHQDRAKFDGGNFMGFEIGVGIPLFFGATKAKVKAAKKEREIAEIEMREERQLREKEYLAALSKCNAAFVRLSYYQQEGGKKADELTRLGTLEYQNGEISYIEYVNALQESIDIRMKHLEAINAYNQSVIALKRMTDTL